MTQLSQFMYYKNLVFTISTRNSYSSVQVFQILCQWHYLKLQHILTSKEIPRFFFFKSLEARKTKSTSKYFNWKLTKILEKNFPISIQQRSNHEMPGGGKLMRIQRQVPSNMIRCLPFFSNSSYACIDVFPCSPLLPADAHSWPPHKILQSPLVHNQLPLLSLYFLTK